MELRNVAVSFVVRPSHDYTRKFRKDRPGDNRSRKNRGQQLRSTSPRSKLCLSGPYAESTSISRLTLPLRASLCLNDLSLNLRWSWDHPTIALFRRLDSDLWEQTNHNPWLMLARIDQKRLAEAEADEAFLAHMDRVWANLHEYLQGAGWFRRAHPEADGLRIAYFSAEFGLTECIPNYAGGLGILSGDHLKSASDLGLPLTGMGLLYQGGYFRQYLNADGWQQETYPINDFHNLPLEPVKDEFDKPVFIDVDFPGRKVFAQIWKVQVGRIPLYLLDTNIDKNSPGD